MEKHPLHLKNPELQTSPEVSNAVERKERATGERMPNDPVERIEAYVDRLENIFLNKDEGTKERNIDMFRDKIHDALIIKRENFPESYFELQMRVARERGEAVESIPHNIREQMKDVAIEDQRASLDAWIDYLTSDDAVYPAWFKYYIWKNITKLSQFDKERGEFKKRTDSTVAPFPDIYREPLAQMADLYQKVKEDNKNLKDKDIQESFSKKFPALYAELIQKSLAASMEGKEEIRGIWTKYGQGSDDADKLYRSLEGKGTGWCTAGKSTAETQINSGDFYVYYSNDKDMNPTQPRLAIRMNGNDKIGEVRGILPHQDVEPMLQETLDEKLSEFGSEANIYRKKSADMKMLTAIENRVKEGEQLGREDLVFLYEINSSIEGFGYQRDPRIAELLEDRDKNKDAPIVFDCKPEEIAHSVKEINEKTKAYIGDWNPEVLKKFPKNLINAYESFPNKKIFYREIELTMKTPEQYTKEIENQGMKINSYAQDILNKIKPFKKVEKENFVAFSVEQLGFPNGATLEDIYNKRDKLGLELCPPQAGPEMRLAYKDQPNGEWIIVAMNSITDRDGYSGLFSVGRSDSGEWLDYDNGSLSNEWRSNDRFVFVSRK